MAEIKSFAVINETVIQYEDFIIPADCQSISFKNIGAVDCTISGYPLAAGDAMLTLENSSIHAVDVSRYELVFDKIQVGLKKLIVVRTFHDFTKSPKQNINS